MPPHALNPEGLTTVPAGRVASIVTYLELTEPVRRPIPRLPHLRLRRFGPRDTKSYRQLFAKVGRDWLWFSRTASSDAQLTAILADPAVDVRVLTKRATAVGFAEIDRSSPGQAKIAFFGLVAKARGTGAAQYLMRRILRDVFEEGVRRVWLHTCTFDHPAAIRFYLAEGFRPYRQAVEIAGDPRLNGLLPLDCAPHVPMIVPGP